jgi:hypothetical protein
MWDEQDVTSRWVQWVCGCGLLVFLVAFGFLLEHGWGSGYGGYVTAAEITTCVGTG